LTRSGFVALIGEPNAGKSTLLNQMVGAKISIVTHKVQTTRTRIRGVSVENQSQIIFVDTPGLFTPRRRLDRAMVAAAWNGKLALVINKIDKVKVNDLLSLSKEINDSHPFVETFMISAEKGKGINDLRRWLASNLPEGPWLYPDDQISDMPLRMIAAEITREKLTLRLHQELPYQLTVETEKWEEKADKSVRIEQIIYLSRSGHKGIVLGKKGETIKAVSMASRLSIEEFLGARVHLFLRLKVREKWMEETERYSEMGLDFKDGNV
jgi:GTP-binding protein Era